MALKIEKPVNAEAFINKAKADIATETKKEIEFPEQEKELKDKTFVVRMPYALWKKAKHKATDDNVTLHEFIVTQIKKGVNY